MKFVTARAIWENIKQLYYFGHLREQSPILYRTHRKERRTKNQ
jgi:hypothetical protein